MAELTWSEFKVDLRQLHDTIGTVKHESGLIEGYMSQIAGQFSQVKADWNTPSELSFEDVQQWFTRVQTHLHDLLDETVRRMQTAYDNYHAAELANTENLRSDVPGDRHDKNGGGDGGSHHPATRLAAREGQPPQEALRRVEGMREPTAQATLRLGAEPLQPAQAPLARAPETPARP